MNIKTKTKSKEVVGLKKHRKPILLSVMCCAIAVAGIIAALAYGSITDEITNTFSVGKVKIVLTETEYPGNEVSAVTPNGEISKNPQISNIGINDAYVFLKVTVPLREVTVADANGRCSEKEMQEIFYMKTSENSIYKTENSFGDKWVELEEYREKREETQTYVFGYKDALGSFKATEPLFDKVQLKNIIENEIDPEQLQEINIKAYAIQSENIPGQTGGNDLSQEELTQIYQMIESE